VQQYSYQDIPHFVTEQTSFVPPVERDMIERRANLKCATTHALLQWGRQRRTGLRQAYPSDSAPRRDALVASAVSRLIIHPPSPGTTSAPLRKGVTIEPIRSGYGTLPILSSLRLQNLTHPIGPFGLPPAGVGSCGHRLASTERKSTISDLWFALFPTLVGAEC